MTDIRKAAQAALEAMDSHPDNSRRSFRDAADRLRAALAQPSQPDAYLYQCDKPGQRTTYASVDSNDTNHWPVDQWASVKKTPLFAYAPAQPDKEFDADDMQEQWTAGFNAGRAQPELKAEQDGGHQAMWPQMIAALASIDAELGLPDDGCNSTGQTLAAIRLLKAQAAHPPAQPQEQTK